MQRYDQNLDDGELDLETAVNRPRADGPRHNSRRRFTYTRSRKDRPATQFNGLHRRRANRWTW